MDFDVPFFERHMVEYSQISRKTISPCKFETRTKTYPGTARDSVYIKLTVLIKVLFSAVCANLNELDPLDPSLDKISPTASREHFCCAHDVCW